MTYEIFFSPLAQKQFDKLERNKQEHIISVLERIKIRPYEFVRKLTGYPFYRLHAGDYRLIIDIKNETLTIIVIEIGYRRNIYK